MNVKIYNNKKLNYIELKHVIRDKVKKDSHINYSLNIILVVRGSMKIDVSNCSYIIGEQSLFIINPFELHCCKEIIGESVEYYVLAINYNWLKGIQNSLFNRNFFLPIKDKLIKDKKLYLNFLENCKLFSSQKKSLIKVHHKLNLLLIDLLENYSSSNNLTLKELYLMDNFIRFMQKNFKNSIKTKEIAKALNTSTTSLSKILKKTFNLTPYKFLTFYRTHKSKEILRKRDDLSLVAYEVGFYDQSHFYKNFQKNFEMTPKTYKNNQVLL